LIRRLTFLLILFTLTSEIRAQEGITPPDSAGVTKIYISLVVNNINDINSASEIMKADLFLTARWKDPRLAHKSKGRIVSKLENMWDPMLTISNRLNITKGFPDEVTILSDGTVVYMQRIFGDFSEDFQLKDFPFDTQKLFIRLTAIGFSASEVELLPDSTYPSGISDKFTLPDWKIVEWNFDNAPYTYLKDGPLMPALTFTFHAKRESGFYVLIFIIPLILIILMSWMVFWLDPKLLASQITVATTSMLTLITYRFVVSAHLPKISYMTTMDQIVLGSSVLIFFTLISAVVTSSLSSMGKEAFAKKIDLRLRWIFPVLYAIVIITALFY
jgi:hypothetical protein